MSNIENKVILITGASGGIGEATARLLAKEGAQVVLGARRKEKLESIVSDIIEEGGKATFETVDVTKKEQVNKFVQFAKEKFGRVDVIVNNAGIMPISRLDALKTDEWDWMIDVNIRGVLHGLAAGLPIMKEQGEGHFINLSSIGGHVVVPSAAVYCATKFAVQAISEGLRQESDDISVTVISPGVTESDLASTISDEETQAAMEEYRKIYIKPEAIARAIRFAVEQPSDVDVSEMIVQPTKAS